MSTGIRFGLKPEDAKAAQKAEIDRAIALARGDGHENPPVAAASAEPVRPISSMTEVPVGEFLDLRKLKSRPLTLTQAECFAVIRAASNMCYLLAPQSSDVRMKMEVMARLRFNGHGALLMPASEDIIRILNERNLKTSAETDLKTETAVSAAARELLLDAEARKTSDIHIETRGDHVELFYRIHGKRLSMSNMSPKRLDAIANYLYNWQSADGSRGTGWDRNDVQDTNFAYDLPSGEGTMHVRFHSAPIHPQGNVQIVMRLLRPAKSAGGFRPLRDVGYLPEQTKAIQEMLTGGSGAVLIVGPTNSGKSTSLQSCVAAIREVRGSLIKVSTIENPVEYEMVGACQMPASEETFNKYLKASLRQDPDVVVVGEIREATAADMSKNLVLAGHKILSTLHVYEAPAAFSRLIELGVPRGLLAMPGFLSGVIYQRLIPVVCPGCSEKAVDVMGTGTLSPELEDRLMRVSNLGVDDVRFAKVGGCDKCDFTGIVSRTPCAEVLRPDNRFLELIRKGEDSAAKEYWLTTLGIRVGNMGPTALSHAILKMRQGLLDPRDVESELALLTADLITS